MTEYVFSARVTLDGVQIVVEANSEEEARAKAEAHDWVDADFNVSEHIDWKIGKKLFS